jgi:hypothetical protein
VVIRLHALGIPVAELMGWSVLPEQIVLLRERDTCFVALLLDGDDTGRRGRKRVLPELSRWFSSGHRCLPRGRSPTRCWNISCVSLLTLISEQTKPAVATAYRVVEQAGLPQTRLVHTRPPMAAVFVGEVRCPREPPGASAARENERSAAE